MQVRKGTKSDIEELEVLAQRSVVGLSAEFYSPAQIASASKYITVPDLDLIDDGTLYAAVSAGKIVGCGGWSKRYKLYTGSEAAVGSDRLLNPAHEAARLRAFFVDPDAARTGVARALFTACRDDALSHGFKRLEAMATLPGVPFYERLGFELGEPASLVLRDGTVLPAVNMALDLLAK